MKGKRDRALLALLLACGLRRHEAANLKVEDLQQREEHWAIVDLVGKAGHIRTVPMPDWVYLELVAWLSSASIDRAPPFVVRSVKGIIPRKQGDQHTGTLSVNDTEAKANAGS
jgi:integrase